MDTLLAVLLIITAVVTVGYWLDFFARGTVQAGQEDWYIRFERAFPAADAWMALACLIAALGLLGDEAYGVAFGLVAAGALVFLGLLDVLFNVQNGLYRRLPGSGQMWAEAVINVWSLGLGLWLLIYLVGKVD
jgi:hypothetical protein